MSETVNVPEVGKVKKQYAYAGVAVVGVLAIMYYRNHKASSSAATASPVAASGGLGDPYPPDGTQGDPTDPYSTDPATGMTYGDESAQGSGFGAGYGYANYGYTGSGYGSVNDTSTTANSGPGSFTTNGDWSQYAINYLTGNGMDSGTVTAALGAYIAGQPVTAAQKAIIDDAIAIAGQPPVTGPGGFPPSIKVTGSVSGGKSYATNPVSGLKADRIRQTEAGIKWNPSLHATSYKLQLHDNGRIVHTANVHNTVYLWRGLKQHTEYRATVLANPADKNARPASVSFRTQ